MLELIQSVQPRLVGMADFSDLIRGSATAHVVIMIATIAESTVTARGDGQLVLRDRSPWVYEDLGSNIVAAVRCNLQLAVTL